MTLSVAQYAETASWFTGGGTRTITGVAWSTGDTVVVVGGTEIGTTTLTGCTNANLTFGAAKASLNVGGSNAAAYIWASDPAVSSQSAQTITITAGGGQQNSGAGCWVITGPSTGLANATANATSAAFSLTVSAGSVVVHGVISFSSTTPNKTPATGSGVATERRDLGDGVSYAQWAAEWVGTAAGTFSFGPNNYSAPLTTIAQVIIEVLASGAPNAPTALVVTAGDTQVSVEWTEGFDGGSAVTDHDIDWATAAAPTTWLGPVATGSTDPNGIVTGLTNGTAYVFRARSVNAFGDGAWSATSASATPNAGTPMVDTPTTATPMGRMGG